MGGLILEKSEFANGGLGSALRAIWQRAGLQTGGLVVPCLPYGREVACKRGAWFCLACHMAERWLANGGFSCALLAIWHMVERWLANGGLGCALLAIWQRGGLQTGGLVVPCLPYGRELAGKRGAWFCLACHMAERGPANGGLSCA